MGLLNRLADEAPPHKIYQESEGTPRYVKQHSLAMHKEKQPKRKQPS